MTVFYARPAGTMSEPLPFLAETPEAAAQHALSYFDRRPGEAVEVWPSLDWTSALPDLYRQRRA